MYANSHVTCCYDSVEIPAKAPFTVFLWGYEVAKDTEGLHKLHLSVEGIVFNEVRGFPAIGEFCVKNDNSLEFNKAYAGKVAVFSWYKDTSSAYENVSQENKNSTLTYVDPKNYTIVQEYLFDAEVRNDDSIIIGLPEDRPVITNVEESIFPGYVAALISDKKVTLSDFVIKGTGNALLNIAIIKDTCSRSTSTDIVTDDGELVFGLVQTVNSWRTSTLYISFTYLDKYGNLVSYGNMKNRKVSIFLPKLYPVPRISVEHAAINNPLKESFATTLQKGCAVKTARCSSCNTETLRYVTTQDNKIVCSNCLKLLKKKLQVNEDEYRIPEPEKQFYNKCIICFKEFLTVNRDRRYCSSCEKEAKIKETKRKEDEKRGNAFFEKYKPRKATSEELVEFLDVCSKNHVNYNYALAPNDVNKQEDIQFTYGDYKHYRLLNRVYVIEGDVDLQHSGTSYNFSNNVEVFVIKNGKIYNRKGVKGLPYYCLDSGKHSIKRLSVGFKDLPEIPQKYILQQKEKNDELTFYIPPLFNMSFPTNISTANALSELTQRLHNKLILKNINDTNVVLDLFNSENFLKQKVDKALDQFKKYKNEEITVK